MRFSIRSAGIKAHRRDAEAAKAAQRVAEIKTLPDFVGP